MFIIIRKIPLTYVKPYLSFPGKLTYYLFVKKKKNIFKNINERIQNNYHEYLSRYEILKIII